MAEATRQWQCQQATKDIEARTQEWLENIVRKALGPEAIK
jgi:hypothetical protein